MVKRSRYRLLFTRRGDNIIRLSDVTDAWCGGAQPAEADDGLLSCAAAKRAVCSQTGRAAGGRTLRASTARIVALRPEMARELARPFCLAKTAVTTRRRAYIAVRRPRQMYDDGPSCSSVPNPTQAAGTFPASLLEVHDRIERKRRIRLRIDGPAGRETDLADAAAGYCVLTVQVEDIADAMSSNACPALSDAGVGGRRDLQPSPGTSSTTWPSAASALSSSSFSRRSLCPRDRQRARLGLAVARKAVRHIRGTKRT